MWRLVAIARQMSSASLIQSIKRCPRNHSAISVKRSGGLALLMFAIAALFLAGFCCEEGRHMPIMALLTDDTFPGR